MNIRAISPSLIFFIAAGAIFAGIILFFIFDNAVQYAPDGQESHAECINNLCTIVPGEGPSDCTQEGAFCGCRDTDQHESYQDGVNFFLMGITRTIVESVHDTCLSGTRVQEYYCNEDGSLGITSIDCTVLGDFTCENGACVLADQRDLGCVDNDNGLAYYVASSAKNDTVSLNDYCLDDGQLGEMHCQTNSREIFVSLFDCATLGNYICEQGACVVNI